MAPREENAAPHHAAAALVGSSGAHANWRRPPFHVGKLIRGLISQVISVPSLDSYLEHVAEANRTVEDAITGAVLDVDKQTILIGMDTAQHLSDSFRGVCPLLCLLLYIFRTWAGLLGVVMPWLWENSAMFCGCTYDVLVHFSFL